MNKINHFGKKVGTLLLAASVILTSLGGAAASEQQDKITVTPFPDQWKYYGQPRTFIQNEHYALSEEGNFSNVSWELDIEEEKVGNQRFVLKGSTEDGDSSFALAADAPLFEVRDYKTDAEALSYKSQEEVERDFSVYSASRESVGILAPEGYLISGKCETGNENWSEELQTGQLQEGKNTVTYFLRSNLNDNTRKAIDQTPKQAVVMVDTIPPAVKDLMVGAECTDVEADGSISIVGEDSATYYYMVVPADYSQEVTTDLIKENVTSGYGIVGFGHVDSSQDAILNFKGLTAHTDYKVYAFLEDIAGNSSEMAESSIFSTEKMALTGEVDVSGDVEVGNVLRAEPRLTSTNTGNLSYQWYRVKLNEDIDDLNEDYDETGGAEEDDLEADLSEDDDEDEDGDDGDDVVEFASARKKVAMADETNRVSARKRAEIGEEEITSLDGADLIEGADSDTYKITKSDIGCRLIACVKAENYSSYVAGSTTTFVPKLMPSFSIPSVSKKEYLPTRNLSKFKLSARWSWVDNTIVPMYGNSGYRAKFTPSDTAIYKCVIARIKVPITKRTLKKSMVSMRKTNMYTGKAIKDNFTIKDKKRKLVTKKDYKAEYIDNKNLGKAIVTINGIGNYKGTVKMTYVISKRTLKSVICRYEKVKVYKGKPIAVGLELENNSTVMKKDRDYTVTYKNNTEIGKATITLEGKGNYRGKRTLKFSIIPKKPSIKRLSKKGKKLRLTLSKGKDVTGYYVYVSSSRSFKKSKTQRYTTTGNGFGIAKMEKGTWYMRIKAYTVRKDGTYISPYSSVKKVKIK